MKGISNWSITGFIVGIVFAVGSFWRYYIQAESYNYIGISYAVVTVGVGILICAVAFLYNRILQQGHTIEAMSEYLADKNLKNR